MRINILISNQQISTDIRRLTANSINHVTACCQFDDEWSSFSKQIIFTNGEISKALLVSDGEEITVPYETLVPGRLELSAVGLGHGGEVRITTRKMLFPLIVYPSGELSGTSPDSYTPELWEQVSSKIGDLGMLNIKSDNLVSAINAVSGGGGASSETDPTVPAWAKQETKPAYTAEEVGAVAVEAGKGLSANDYTNAEKDKLAALPETVIVTFSGMGIGSTASMTAQQIFQVNQAGKIVYARYGTALYLLSFANAQTAQFYGFGSENATQGLVIAGNKIHQIINNTALQKTGDRVTSLSSSSTHAQYPSAKAVYDALLKPTAKTDAMTQSVGADADGKLWTAPGSGGTAEAWELLNTYDLTAMIFPAVITLPTGKQEILFHFEGIADTNKQLSFKFALNEAGYGPSPIGVFTIGSHAWGSHEKIKMQNFPEVGWAVNHINSTSGGQYGALQEFSGFMRKDFACMILEDRTASAAITYGTLKIYGR